MFIPNKSFGQLLGIYIWFNDQNSKDLEMEDKLNTALVINQSRKYKE